MSQKIVINVNVRRSRWPRDPQVDKAILVILGIVGVGFVAYVATDGCKSCEPRKTTPPPRDEVIEMRRDYAAGVGRHGRIKQASAVGLGAEDLVIEAADPPCDDAFLHALATNGELARRHYFTVRCGDGTKVVVDWNSP